MTGCTFDTLGGCNPATLGMAVAVSMLCIAIAAMALVLVIAAWRDR